MRVLLMQLSVLLILSSFSWAEGASRQFFPYPYQKHTLSNGLTAFLIPIPGSGLVAYYTVVRTGSRDEWEPGKSGFAHFFEHMMFRGTQKYPGDVYNRLVTEMGADANAYTTDDYTCYYMVVPGENLKKVMDLESDRFRNLHYAESEFRTEAGAVYGEYRKNRTSPWSIAHEEMMNLAFTRHTYKHTTIGFEEDIKNMPNLYEYSKSFFRRYYRPDNVVLMIAGDFNPEEAKKWIDSYYGGWEKGYVPPKIESEPPQKEERRKEVAYSGRTLPIIWMGYKGDAFDPTNKMVVAANLLGYLAFGENSDIYKQLVIREQKVQFIAAEFGFNRDPKLYSIYSMVKKEEDIPYVMETIDATVERFQTELIAPEKLENIKKRLRYSFLMGLDTPDNVASRLARIVAITGGIEAVDQLYRTMETITTEDIRAAAQRYLQSQQRTVITVKGEQQ